MSDPSTTTEAPMALTELPCCPELVPDKTCDVVDFRRRLVFPTDVEGRGGRVLVEVVVHTRFTRCPGPLALGDPIYSTTLLPGETVRLATTDRRSRFSFDSETSLSARSEQMSEEQYRMSALRALMSDENSTNSGSDKSQESGKWDFHGDASGGIGFFSVNADTNASGSHNASSSRDWLVQHKAHAEMSDNQSVQATRMAHSVSVAEVATRSHQEGESEDQYESSSRTFRNENRCHAVTYLFYRINKTETMTFTLEAIERRVIDPVAPVPIQANPHVAVGGVFAVPQDVPAAAKSRLAAEEQGLQSVQLYRNAASGVSVGAAGRLSLAFPTFPVTGGSGDPLDAATRQEALDHVDRALMSVGLLDDNRQVSQDAKDLIEFTHEASLPTAGVIVKGCLDGCDTCEPTLERRIELELDRMELENKLLARQIELLDKSQEYRCCPAGSAEDGGGGA